MLDWQNFLQRIQIFGSDKRIMCKIFKFLLSSVSYFLTNSLNSGVLMTSEYFVLRGNLMFTLTAVCAWVFIGLPFVHQKAAGYKWDARGAGGSFLNSPTVPFKPIQFNFSSTLFCYTTTKITG